MMAATAGSTCKPEDWAVIYALEGLTPQIHPSAWVAPTASVIGDVVLEERVSVWFGCTLRGDAGQIRVGPGTNIQDGSVLHEACTIGADCTIAHQVLVHRATVGDRVLIGNGALVYDDVEIGAGAVVGAQSGVHRDVPAGSSVLGTPERAGRRFHKEMAALGHLPDLLQRVRALEAGRGGADAESDD